MENNKEGCHIVIGGWFVSVLTIVFVIAKLIGLINWSWWLVFSPMIISFILGCSILIIIAILYIWMGK